ncbi:MAG: hypothetical protein IIV27_04270 [Clostridia bacterium]|nr:hypothetical protein [Clostridia bacterium]
MNIFQKLTYGYSMLADGSYADVSGQDFVDHLSIGAPGWVGAWVAVGLAVIFGLLVYVFPVIMTENEHIQCYPLWLHCFYWAADFMGIWVFIHAWQSTTTSFCSCSSPSVRLSGSGWKPTV